MPAKTLSARTLSAKAKPRRKVAKKPQRTSRTRKPLSMTLEEWQVALRRSTGASRTSASVTWARTDLSSFTVHNPGSGRTYRVAIAGRSRATTSVRAGFRGEYARNVQAHQWLLAKLARKRRGRRRCARLPPALFRVYLRYGAERAVHLTRGSACDVRAARLLDRYFDAEGRLGEGGGVV